MLPKKMNVSGPGSSDGRVRKMRIQIMTGDPDHYIDHVRTTKHFASADHLIGVFLRVVLALIKVDSKG